MSNIDQSKLTEMIRLARASLNEEFLQKQSEAYKNWYVSSNQTWKNTGTMLPPVTVKLVYPAEKDIVQRALEIYNTLNPVVEAVPQQTVPTPVAAELVAGPTVEIEPMLEIINEVVEPSTAVEDIVPIAVATVPEEIISPLDIVTPVLTWPIAPVVEAVPAEEKEKENKLISLLTKWGGKGSF